MKKVILFLAVVVFAASADAQNSSWGIKGGVSLANVTNTNILAEDGGKMQAGMRTSFYVGAFYEYRIDNVGISPEIVYSSQGTEFDSYMYFVGNEYGLVDLTIRLNYINIPIMAKLYIIKNVLSLDVGPQFGFLTGANASREITSGINGNNSATTVSDDEDVTDSFSGFDFSVGLGATLNLGKFFLISARYNLTTNGSDYSDNDKITPKNSVFQFGAGFRF